MSLLSLPCDLRLRVMSMLSLPDLVLLLRASLRFSKDLDCPAILEREGLPGRSAWDLINHVTEWEDYRLELFQSLYKVVPDLDDRKNDLDSDEGKVACREFLKRAIWAFTKRVASAHSWYKHLPMGYTHHEPSSDAFEFILDLASNMRREGKKWIPKVRGDLTEFHYTWTTTEEYRDKFGFFEYNDDAGSRAFLRVHRPCTGEAIHVPRYARSPLVPLTAHVHPRSTGFYMFEDVLLRAVKREQPHLVHEPIAHEQLPGIQGRFAGRDETKRMRIPGKAANHLEEIAKEIILERQQQRHNTSNGDELHQHEAPLPIEQQQQERALRALCCERSMEAGRAQHERELAEIVKSLWELCRRNFGDDRVPAFSETTHTSSMKDYWQSLALDAFKSLMHSNR